MQEIREFDMAVDGVVVNTFDELEHGSTALLAAAAGKKVLAVGPVSLCRTPSLDQGSKFRPIFGRKPILSVVSAPPGWLTNRARKLHSAHFQTSPAQYSSGSLQAAAQCFLSLRRPSSSTPSSGGSPLVRLCCGGGCCSAPPPPSWHLQAH